jgi:putative PIN family toxin of toxin-antitoxin system
MPMRVILDTDVLLSALLSPLGPPANLIELWERNDFTLVACEALIAELREVAGRPFFRAKLRVGAAEGLAAGIREFSFFCRKLPSGADGPHFAGDPKDSYLLALAEACQCEFLVTGDQQLLSLRQHKSTRIITAAAIVEILES